jgi:hypothetical protein
MGIAGLGELEVIGSDRVLRGHGEIRGKPIERKPGDFVSLSRFAVFGPAAGNAAQISGRNPMLVLPGQDVVGEAEKAFDGDFKAYFLASFAECACLEGFLIFQLATDNAPAAHLGRQIAQREQYATASIKDQNTHADPRNRYWCSEIVFCGHSWRWKWAEPCRAPAR